MKRSGNLKKIKEFGITEGQNIAELCVNYVSVFLYFTGNHEAAVNLVILQQIVRLQIINLKMFSPQANLVVQEARLAAAMSDLQKAQAQLDERERELAAVRADYDKAMTEKQVE